MKLTLCAIIGGTGIAALAPWPQAQLRHQRWSTRRTAAARKRMPTGPTTSKRATPDTDQVLTGTTTAARVKDRAGGTEPLVVTSVHLDATRHNDLPT